MEGAYCPIDGETSNDTGTMPFRWNDKTKFDAQAHSVLHDGAAEANDKPLAFRALLVRPVIIAAGSYATYSLVDIAFQALIPVFYAQPIEMGGLNLDPRAIGIILGRFGTSGGILRWLLFAPMFDWPGVKTLC